MRFLAGLATLMVPGLLLYAAFMQVQSLKGTRGDTATRAHDSASLTHKSFDPDNPPGPIDPRPAIEAYMNKASNGQTVSDDERRAIDAYAAGFVGDGLPLQIDSQTTRVGVATQGRYILIDTRGVIPNPLADLAASRARLFEGMSELHNAGACDAATRDETMFRHAHNLTVVYAYTLNDGNPPLFVEVPPQKCGR